MDGAKDVKTVAGETKDIKDVALPVKSVKAAVEPSSRLSDVVDAPAAAEPSAQGASLLSENFSETESIDMDAVDQADHTMYLQSIWDTSAVATEAARGGPW